MRDLVFFSLKNWEEVKLWEYLAAGKPIVSTDAAGFRDYPQWVLADDAPTFVVACRAALSEIGTDASEQLKRAPRAEAIAHSWTSRVDQLLHEWYRLGWQEADESQIGDEVAAARPKDGGKGVAPRA